MSKPINPKLTLINPWIYDFTAYDLWSKPLGLLYLASFLRVQGFSISYFDCLDKYTPTQPKPKIRKYGIGHYSRTIVEKPEILKHIPRHFARYGVPEDDLIQFLKANQDTRAVLVTSLMTYWYPGVKRVVELVRQFMPGIPVILGGVYASLLEEHARKVIDPDYIVTGSGEIKVLNLLSQITGLSADDRALPEALDDYPYPAFDLVNHPDYLLMMTSRGCPYNCSFCAQKLISSPFMQRSVHSVLDEFGEHYRKFRLKDFAFYDDALFMKSDKHIKPILEQLIRRRLPLRLHSPNGLFAREIDSELAKLMFKSQFKTIRLSFETSNEDRRHDMNSKVSNDDLTNAVKNLTSEGYRAADLECYVMMGLPDQSLEEVVASILFVHNLGVMVRLASFSPIHGTKDFDRSVDAGLISADIDPLLTNKTIFPLNSTQEGYEKYRKLRILARILNEAASRGLSLFSDADIAPVLKNVIGRSL